MTLATSTYNRLSPEKGYFIVLAKFADGADEAATTAAVEKSLTPFPEAKVQTKAEYKDSFAQMLNSILYLLYLLLALTVIISLFGIVNTMALSVFERTREIGMLRAIGTTRRQLRRMIRYESVITGIIGGLFGIVIGIGHGVDRDAGAEGSGHRVRAAVGADHRLPDRGGARRRARGGVPGAPGGQAERAASAAVRVACKGATALRGEYHPRTCSTGSSNCGTR